MRRPNGARHSGAFATGLLLLLGGVTSPLIVRAADDGLSIPIRVSPEGKPLQPHAIVIPDGPVLPKPLAAERWRQDRSGVASAPMQDASLVLDSPRQRGLSNEVWARPGELRMAGIGVGGDVEQNLFGDGSSAQSDGQPRGMVLSRSLSGAHSPEALSVTGTYVKTEASVDALGQIEGSSGDATNLALDSQLLGGRLQLRGQYAFSRYDADGPQLNSESQDGNASAFLARLNALDVPLAGEDLRWALGARHREVGAAFHSPANPNLTTDQRLNSVFSELSWGGLSAAGELALTENNLDNDPTRLRTRGQSVSARLRYQPPQTQDDGAHLFDRPDVELNYRQAGSQDAVGNPLNSYEEVGVSAAFSPGDARWSLGYSVARNEDQTGWGSDTLTQTRSLAVSLPLGPYLTFSPSFQDRQQQYVQTSVAETQLNLGARLALHVSRKWSGALGYRYSAHGASDGSVDARSSEISARIEHQFQSPRSDRPGIKLHLQGTYQKYENELEPAGNYDQRDAEVGVQFDWPLD